MTCLQGNVADGRVHYEIPFPLLFMFVYIVLVAQFALFFVIQLYFET